MTTLKTFSNGKTAEQNKSCLIYTKGIAAPSPFSTEEVQDFEEKQADLKSQTVSSPNWKTELCLQHNFIYKTITKIPAQSLTSFYTITNTTSAMQEQ